ncbi:DUF971 domain-containing protein [Aquipseudomonas alcaligenes]|uniref:DUF971 domain-containing protein n=1 Tax=Aquipseudomonas alcaligenes TaxID=43263 RepID=UPI0037499B77
MNAPSALRSAAGQLCLEWSDGRVSQLSHARLRAACPCSQCRAARLHGRIDAVPSEVRLRAINQQGYGVQLVFSDGHDKGIYPWSYLQELMQC